MYKRVLFATDLSKASDVALGCLAGWKKLDLSKVSVVHVHNIQYAGGASGMEEQLRADHTPKLERQAQRLRDAGIHASWRLEFGIPYLEVERIAREEGCEVVVIGSHGGSWIKEVWLGSIADAILRHVNLPVLVLKVNRLLELPPEACVGLCDSMFGRVLLATDFSPATASAVDAVRLLSKRGAEVRLVHIQEHSRIYPHLASRLDEFNREDTRRLEQLAEELRGLGAREVTLDVRTDHAIKGLSAAIHEWQPRLVTVGRHGRNALAGRLIGSISHHMAHESPVPVLVVPHVQA